MARAPSAPAAQVSGYPLSANAAAERDGTRHRLAEETASRLKPQPGGRGLRIAAGAAVGSAAIAAALIFYNRSK